MKLLILRAIFLICSAMILSGCPFGEKHGISEDLTIVCNLASIVEEDANGTKLTMDQAIDGFNAKLKSAKAKTKWGKKFFVAYSSMVGEGKYDVAREAAAEKGLKDWRCESMERLFSGKNNR